MSVNNFLTQTWPVIPLATGDKVIKFWKVKVGGEVCALLNALLVAPVFIASAIAATQGSRCEKLHLKRLQAVK